MQRIARTSERGQIEQAPRAGEWRHRRCIRSFLAGRARRSTAGPAWLLNGELHESRANSPIQILPRMPLVLGHENAGVVAAVGAGVMGVKEGEPVAVFGGWGCGRCDYGITGAEQLCETPEWAGLSIHDGGYAEYLLVPHERYLVKLTKLSPVDAAPLTDAALTPYRAIRKAWPFLQPDQNALLARSLL